MKMASVISVLMDSSIKNIKKLRRIALIIIALTAFSIFIMFLRTLRAARMESNKIVAIQINYFNEVHKQITYLLKSFVASNEEELRAEVEGRNITRDIPVYAYEDNLVDGIMLVNKDHVLIQGKGDDIALEGLEVCLNRDAELQGIHTCPVSLNTVLYSIVPVAADSGNFYVLFYKLLSDSLADNISTVTGFPVRFAALGAAPEKIDGFSSRSHNLKDLDGKDLIQMVSYFPFSVHGWLIANFITMLSALLILAVLAHIMTALSRVANLSKTLEKRNTALKRLSDDKESLLRVLSHDLKNYITSIFGYTDLILMEDNLNGSVRNMATYIRESAEQQDHIIDLVREQLALESGKYRPELQPIELAPVIESMLRDFRFRMEEKEIECVLGSGIDCCRVLADPLTLSVNALNNVISNAIKFSPSRGKIEIDARAHLRDKIELMIKDEGIGIPDDLLTKLWDPSAHTTRPGTMGEKGTGFGMPLVQKTLRSMGGDVRIESRDQTMHPENSGTSVYLILQAVN